MIEHGPVGGVESGVESAAGLRARGRAARRSVSRSALGRLTVPERDPVAILDAQDVNRLPDLVPLRRARMSVNPFTFYRGSAAIMAHDLALQEATGAQVVACGDAHLSNFGLYASPERRLVFDLNDFDEAAPGPWEWDVKRLVTSVLLAADSVGLSGDRAREAALVSAAGYRRGLLRLLDLDALGRFYFTVDTETIQRTSAEQTHSALAGAVAKATRRTSAQAVRKLMTVDDQGRERFIEDPPVTTHVLPAIDQDVATIFEQYRATVRPDVRMLLSRFTLTDVARRVVGVGSVGTRCYILALTGDDGGHLVLQVKEASPSVVTMSNRPNDSTPDTLRPGMSDGERVVVHQQILQGVSDPFLGWLIGPAGRHFYVRQFRDMKGSVEIETLTPAQFLRYVEGCGLLLARAHAQSPMAHWIAGYIGSGDRVDRAVVDWSQQYLPVVQDDYRRYCR